MFERDSKSFANGHYVVLRQHLAIHLLQVVVKLRSRGIDKFGSSVEILREIRETLILGDKRNDIHSETVDPTVDPFVQPEPHEIVDLTSYPWIVPIQVGLFFRKKMKIIFVPRSFLLPGGTGKKRNPVIRLATFLRGAPDVVIGVGV